MAASDPHNHDASLSDAAENLGLRSLSYAHRGLRVSFNVLPRGQPEPAARKNFGQTLYGKSGIR